MNWGKCDFGELKRLEEKIKKFEEVDFDETCRKAAEKLAQILLAKVVRRTRSSQAGFRHEPIRGQKS
ncbi:MAG: HK97 gp10 family phage protein [Eubacteriales bacterium]